MRKSVYNISIVNMNSLLEVNVLQKLKDDIKQKIIEVGKKRFKKEGYENTSMKDIALDAGISTGNIYRYFLTKKHLLNEILKEVEENVSNFVSDIPSDYQDIDSNLIFEELIELTLKLAKENKDTLKVMLNSETERQFTDFKEQILDMFTNKLASIVKSITGKEKVDITLCNAISRAQFEGFTYIVRNNVDNIEDLKRNLEIYKKLMLSGLSEKVMEVIKDE